MYLQPDLDSASPQASHEQSNRSRTPSVDSSDSQDTVIIEETSSSKRMRLDEEAKKVGIKFFFTFIFLGIFIIDLS